MKEYQLKNIDAEDIEELLLKVETSFDIRFVDAELGHITTFGQFCDHIANKIQLANSEDCTSQQAFYKLRNAVVSALHIDRAAVTTDLLLADLLPRKKRRSRTNKLERSLGFKLNILRPPHWVTWTFVILSFVSIVGLFIYWQIGLLGLLVAMGGLWVSNKVGIEMDVATIGQLAEKMTRENYIKSRRNPKTFNKTEVEKILTDWFSNAFDLDKDKLTRNAEFV